MSARPQRLYFQGWGSTCPKLPLAPRAGEPPQPVRSRALHSLFQALREGQWLDLAGESSAWTLDGLNDLYADLVACGFAGSPSCSGTLLENLGRLRDGTPLFGDGFLTEWSYYSILRRSEVLELVADLTAAVDFERPLPAYVPPQVRDQMVLRLSPGALELATQLGAWCARIAAAGEDVYALWW